MTSPAVTPHDRVWAGLVWVALGALAAARVAYLWFTPYDLLPDEAYYWDWSRRLDIAYRTKPPLVAWVIAAARGLGGDRAPVVRLPAAVASVAAVGVIGLLARRLYGPAGRPAPPSPSRRSSRPRGSS